METSAFITSLVTSLLIFVLLVLLYSWLSRTPSNFVIYYPLRIIRGLGPPTDAERRSPWTWLKAAWQATENDIITLAGLDAAVYVNFLDAALKIFTFAAIVLVPILVPLAVTSDNYSAQKRNPHNASDPSFGGFDKLAMGNVSEKDKDRIWAFLAAAYWVSIITYTILWKKYKHIVFLRNRELSVKARPEQFTVLIQNIPSSPNESLSQQVDAFFKKLHPEAYEKCLVVTKLKKVSKLWRELQSNKQKLKHAEAVLEESKTKTTPDGSQPQHKTGFLGLVGTKVNSIEYYQRQIKDLTLKLQAEQKRSSVEEQDSAAFAFFNNRVAAAEVGQSVVAPVAGSWRTSQAPGPQEVVWDNLAMPYLQQLTRQFGIYFLVFLIVVFFMIPISFVSAFTSLNNLVKLAPFIKPIVKISVLNTVLQAYLPQLALIIFLALLPSLLMYLSKNEGIVSQSHLARATSGKYFYFNVVNVFLGVTLAGTVFNSIKQIVKTPSKTISLLDLSIPPQASFFITFIALRFFVGFGLEISRFVPLVVFHLKRRYMCKTEEEIREAWAPGPISYHTQVPGDMLIFTIATCYAVIAPMVLPFAILYFVLAWFIFRNQVLNVYVPAYESGGRMWPHIQSRILASLFVSQLTMLGYFSAKKFVCSFLLIPLPIATLLFAYLCRKLFYPSFSTTPLAFVSSDPKELPSAATLAKAYTPPCLLPEENSDDVDKFEDAQSNVPSQSSSGIMSPA